ncbi:MAG: hypothetical protein HY678_00405 [Chloroflexi bacterium]|nr:hypothetical protein [Chloroflexota bacterium]
MKDGARTFTISEEFVTKAQPNRRLIVAKRYDAAVAGAVRVIVDGKDAGVWELPQREFFFGESTFAIPAELITSNATRLRFVHIDRSGSLPANSYYYWVMVDG